MKKNLLMTSSLLVLAACANNAQEVDLTEQALDIQPTMQKDAGFASDASAYADTLDFDSIDAANLDEKTAQLRTALAAITPNKIYFEFDSSAIDEGSKEKLTLAANFILATDKVSKIVIEGHADERGTREYNLALGERRAVAVKKYLVGLGLDSDMIETISFGKEKPMATEHTNEAWAKNRRAVVLLEAK